MKTQRDVALAAGVSVMAVSRVLGNRPGVSESTREKVRAAIRETGFRVSASLGSWRMSRRSRSRNESASMVLLTGEDPDIWPDQGSWREVRAVASAHATERHATFDALIMNTRGGVTPERARGILRARGVGGVLLGPGLTEAGLSKLPLNHLAVVALDLAAQDQDVDRVSVDSLGAMDRLLHAALESGARRPALITGTRSLLREALWEGAFREAQRACIPAKEQISPFAAPTDPAKVADWIRSNRPDFIFSSAKAVFELARSIGLPARERLCGLDLPPDYLGEAFSGVYPPMKEIAEIAVDLVISKAGRGAFGHGAHPKFMLLPATLHLAPDAPPALATLELPAPGSRLGLEFEWIEHMIL